MLKACRSILLALGALALVAAPCAPAMASVSSCTMPGCEDSPFGSISSAVCCCGAAGAPAQTSSETSIARLQVKMLASSVTPEPAPAAEPVASDAQLTLPPPTPVPLFLLNASLLI